MDNANCFKIVIEDYEECAKKMRKEVTRKPKGPILLPSWKKVDNDEYSSRFQGSPFVMPESYIKINGDRNPEALARGTVVMYELDDEDFTWFKQSGLPISEDDFEKLLDTMEKATFLMDHRICSFNAVKDSLANVADLNLAHQVYKYWRGKWERLKMSSFPPFQVIFHSRVLSMQFL